MKFIHILMEKHSFHKYFWAVYNLFFMGGGGGGGGGVDKSPLLSPVQQYIRTSFAMLGNMKSTFFFVVRY